MQRTQPGTERTHPQPTPPHMKATMVSEYKASRWGKVTGTIIEDGFWMFILPLIIDSVQEALWTT